MSSTIDEQFVDFIVKTIVGNPDKVSIKRTIDEKGVLLELTVDPEDLGRVIGKRGAAAQALRTLLRALGTKNDARYNLKIVDVGGERPPRKEHSDDEHKSEEVPREQDNQDKSEDSSSEKTEDKPAEQTEDAVLEEEPKDEPAAEAEEEQTDGRSSFERTRRELQDLDDLDI